MSVHIETDGPVTTVVIDRPEARNAVDGPTATALAEAFRAFDADPDQAVAVLTGAGGTFCAGADLKAIGTPTGNQVHPDGTARRRGRPDGPMGPTRLRLGKPVIAAIEGYAVAGGIELAVWCDLRVAAEDATLGVFCRRWGVPLIDGGTVRLPRLIGTGRALDLILTGRGVGAAEAHAMGLVDRVVPPGDGPRSGRGAGPRAGRAPAGLPAQRPAVGLRPGGTAGGGRAARRARARHAVARTPTRSRARPGSPQGRAGTVRRRRVGQSGQTASRVPGRSPR